MEVSPDHVIELFDAMDTSPAQTQAVMDEFTEYFQQDTLQLFIVLGQILQTEGINTKYYKRLFTYSNRCINILNSQSNALEIINEQADGLLNELLEVAIRQIPSMPNEAGSYYGHIVLLFIGAEDEDVSMSASLIQHLAQFLEENMSQNVALGAFSAFSIIAEEAILFDSQYSCILTNAFNCLYKTEYSTDIHGKCLDTIYHLIKTAKEIIEDDDNKQILFSTLSSFVEKPSTKPKVYRCYGMIAKHYYDQFAEIANQIVEGALEYLNGNLNEQDRLAICHFFKSLAIAEKRREDKNLETLSAIETTFESIFPTFMEIIADVASPEPDVGGQTNSNSIAREALEAMVQCCQETAKPMCIEFFQENIQNESFGVREAAVHEIATVLPMLDDEELVSATELILEAIPLLFEDEALRLKEDGALLLMVLVHLYRQNGHYDELREHVEPLIPDLLQLSINEPIISEATMGAVTEMVRCKNFPLFSDSITQFMPLFESEPIETLTRATSSFLYDLVTGESHLDSIIELLPSIIELVEASRVSDSDAHRNQVDIIWILCAFIKRVGVAIEPHKDELMTALTEEFAETGQCDSMNLLAISCLLKALRSAQVPLEEYLDVTMEMAFYFLQQYGNPSEIEDAVGALNTICAVADLTPFIPRAMELVREGIETLRENVLCVSYFLDLATALLTRPLYSQTVIECGALDVFHAAGEIATAMPVDGADAVYFASACASFFVAMLEGADAQSIVQWFDAIVGFARQVSYLEDEGDPMYDSTLEKTALLLLKLVDVSQEQFAETVGEDEEIQALLAAMIGRGGRVRANALHILRENGTPYEEEDAEE